MSDPIFPATLPGIAITKRRTAEWSTTVQGSVGGRELTLQHWTYPKWKYSLSIDVLRSGAEAELQQVLSVFHACAGRAGTFLFDDEDDNAATAEVFGLGDGTHTAFQLSRTESGFAEPVRAVKPGIQLYVNGSPAAGSVNPDTGIATYSGAPAGGAVLSWTGGFYWRCRWLDDSIEFERFLRQLWAAKKIEFRTVK